MLQPGVDCECRGDSAYSPPQRGSPCCSLSPRGPGGRGGPPPRTWTSPGVNTHSHTRMHTRTHTRTLCLQSRCHCFTLTNWISHGRRLDAKRVSPEWVWIQVTGPVEPLFYRPRTLGTAPSEVGGEKPKVNSGLRCVVVSQPSGSQLGGRRLRP